LDFTHPVTLKAPKIEGLFLCNKQGGKMKRKTKQPDVQPYRDPYQDEAIVGGLRPFFRAEDRASQRWGGITRLQSLVSPELSARYGSAYAKLQAAIKSFDSQETARLAGVCIRGLEALDKAASEHAEAFEPRALYLQHHGRQYVVALDRIDLPAIKAPEGVPVLSVEELLECRQILLDGQIKALDAIQTAFPGSQVSFKGKGDALPF
jgi:hypothetical protein